MPKTPQIHPESDFSDIKIIDHDDQKWITAAELARCELSSGCPFDPIRVGWSYQAPTLFGGIE